MQQTKSDKKANNYKKRCNRNRRRLEKTAKKLIEDGSVVILVKEEVPLGAISVLGKGVGYVPYPSQNMEQTRLEMRLTVNRIINLSRRKNSSLSSSIDDNNINSNKVYSKLKRTYHGIVPKNYRRCCK